MVKAGPSVSVVRGALHHNPSETTADGEHDPKIIVSTRRSLVLRSVDGLVFNGLIYALITYMFVYCC